MAINPESITKITQEAYSALKNRPLGGVSKESAQNAISEAVNKVVQLGEEAVGKVQQEIQTLKGKTAQEIADITSQKDAFILHTKQNAQKEIEQAQQKAAEVVKQAKSTKSAEKILPNGHKQIRSVNKNGAVMVKEYNEAGQLLKFNVTTLDGTIRRTSFDPVSGKPIKTFTNTTGEDITIEYPINAAYPQYASAKIQRVNNKKTAPKKPELVTQTRPEPVKSGWSGEYGQKFDRIYSDGSKETISRFADSSGKIDRTKMERFDKDGKCIADKTVWRDGEAVREHIYKEGKTISREAGTYSGNKKYEHTTETVYDPNTNKQVISKAQSNIDGDKKITYTVVKDEFGFYTGKYIAKTTYPKGSGKQPEIQTVDVSALPHVF